MSVYQELNNLKDLFIIFDNPQDKFVQLMDMAKESEHLNDSEKIENNKIYGCTSQAWVVADSNLDSTFTFRTDSDALIIKGLLVILEKIFNNQPAKEILAVNSKDILLSVGLSETITSQRTNGFSNAVARIQSLVQ